MGMALERKRTALDIGLGVLLFLAGLWVLANAVFATAFLVLAIAWTALISGLLMLLTVAVGVRSQGVIWSTLIGGAVLTVLGLFMLRNPVIGAVALTLMAGALFFVSGLVRVGLSTTVENHRWVYVASGVISIVLGLWIVFNPATASLKVLGILLGIQMLAEGLTLVIAGRLRVVRDLAAPKHSAPTQ